MFVVSNEIDLGPEKRFQLFFEVNHLEGIRWHVDDDIYVTGLCSRITGNGTKHAQAGDPVSGLHLRHMASENVKSPVTVHFAHLTAF